MLIKTISTIVILFVSTITLKAQEAEIKGSKVLINDKEVFKYDKVNGYELSLFTLDGEEILLFRWNDNETPKYPNDDYFILNFLTEKKKIESKSTSHVLAGLGMSSKKNMQKTINWLLKERVLDAEGKINKDRLDIFYDKYNEDITIRTIR